MGATRARFDFQFNCVTFRRSMLLVNALRAYTVDCFDNVIKSMAIFFLFLSPPSPHSRVNGLDHRALAQKPRSVTTRALDWVSYKIIIRMESDRSAVWPRESFRNLMKKYFQIFISSAARTANDKSFRVCFALDVAFLSHLSVSALSAASRHARQLPAQNGHRAHIRTLFEHIAHQMPSSKIW